jgi:hypothetical protein
MSTGFTRRSLATGIGTAGLGLGGLAMLPPDALSQTAFTSFAFQATGEPTARTMPDRLAEIKNVVDFGADPTGGSDSTNAIQNAVNWTTGPNRGTIYFPLGFYKTSAPITFNYNPSAGQPGLNICFRGEGSGSQIIGIGFSSGGYILDRHLGSPNNTAQVVIEKMLIQFDGTVTGGVRLGSCNSIMVKDCCLGSLTTEDSAGNSSQNILLENCVFAAGGIIVGGSGAILQCGFKNCTTAARMYGKGWYMGGNRIENCGTAYLLGLDSAGTDQGTSGFAIIGGTMEGNWTNIDFSGTCSGFYLGSLGVIGHDNTNAGPNPPSIQGTQYGLFVRANKASYGIFQGLSIGNYMAVAAGEVDAATSRANLLFLNCTFNVGGGGGQSWILPSNAYTAQWQQCNIDPIWRYSQLPTGGNVLEGDQFSISDSTTNTWGANVTVGSGGNRVLVRYNGSNYTVVAK